MSFQLESAESCTIQSLIVYWINLVQLNKGHVNIGIIFLFIGNSQWRPFNSDWLINTQSRALQANWLILEISKKAILNINMHYWQLSQRWISNVIDVRAASTFTFGLADAGTVLESAPPLSCAGFCVLPLHKEVGGVRQYTR